MARYSASLRTDRSRDDVFAYLADMRNFTEWDPGTRRVVQIVGDGAGPGTEFDVTTESRRPVTLRYRTITFDPPHLVVAEVSSSKLEGEDRIRVEDGPDGTVVTYDATLRFTGALRFVDPIFQLVFNRIGAKAVAGLREELAAVAIES